MSIASDEAIMMSVPPYIATMRYRPLMSLGPATASSALPIAEHPGPQMCYIVSSRASVAGRIENAAQAGYDHGRGFRRLHLRDGIGRGRGDYPDRRCPRDRSHDCPAP